MANVQFTTDPMPKGVEEKINKDEFNEKVKRALANRLAESILRNMDFLVIMNKDRTITYKGRVGVIPQEDLPPWSENDNPTKQIHS